MNRLVLILLSCISIQSIAQEQPKEKVHFYTNKKGKLYVPKKLPMFLYLTSDTIEKKDMQRLKSETTTKYANPFYFDSEGRNTVHTPWAVDPKNHVRVEPRFDVVFDVYVDGSAPISYQHIDAVHAYRTSGVDYYGPETKMTITAKDRFSGVESTHFSVNGAPYEKNKTSLDKWIEGENTIKYFSMDQVGHVEKAKERHFIYDTQAPTTKHKINGPQFNDIISPKCCFELTSHDSLSGVRRIFYRLDNRKMKQYLTCTPLGDLKDGVHKIYWQAKDNVENMEKESSIEIYLDKVAPVTTYKMDGDFFKSGKIQYISERSKFVLEATDNKAGVKETYKNLDHTSQDIYKEPFTIEGKFGKHIVAYWSRDKVENVEKIHSTTLFLDNKSPITQINYNRPQFFTRDTLFIGLDTKFTLYPGDKGSGVAKTFVTINDGEAKEYKKSQKLDKEGFYKVTFHSIDNVNNEETAKVSEVYVDGTAPEIYVNFSIKQIGTEKKDGKDIPVYPNYTRMYVGATDKLSGTDQIQYSINGAPYNDYSSPKTLDLSELDLFKDKKHYVVKVRATDKLKNSRVKVFEFVVKDE
ncbi:hypothetical protein K4L44_04550 [Halosquirtibacter laminarini]|uniref:Uncharacterized protein n=1 Tax=Halosquirtibacter laminarini TaxID=3374600 RepID=A0AC61NHF8_9BACT|nr:hypothetical protein K4L44_04550 [Prolixibacteraceae bacterium]